MSKKWRRFRRKASGDNLRISFWACVALSRHQCLLLPSPLLWLQLTWNQSEVKSHSNWSTSVNCSIDYHVHFELISFYKLVKFELKLIFKILFLFTSVKHSTCYMFNLAFLFYFIFLEFYFVENFNTTLKFFCRLLAPTLTLCMVCESACLLVYVTKNVFAQKKKKHWRT